MRVPGRQRETRDCCSYASPSRRLIPAASLAYPRKCRSSQPVVCSSRSTTRTGSVSSQRFSNHTSGASLRTESCSESLPSFASLRMESEAKAFEVEPMRNSVSGLLARSAATSALPRPAIHSGPSLCTIATDTPGVCASCRIFSSCCWSSAIDCAAGGVSSFLSFLPCEKHGVARRQQRSRPAENFTSCILCS
jgi:hypothetical protein